MTSFARQVRQHRGLVLLLLSGFVVPLLTNLLSSWLEQVLGQNPAQLLQLLAVGFAVAVALWVLYLALRQGPPRWVLVSREQQPPTYPGLILLVGPGRPDEDPLKGSAGPAIEYHLAAQDPGSALRVCWLLTSEPGVPVAEALRQQYESHCRMLICPIHQAFDVQETHDQVRRIYQELAPAQGLAPAQVIADFTGGTKMMSAGVVLACRDQWPMQYMTGRKEKGDTRSVPILVRFQRDPSGF